jgi:predicted DNA-binding ribbon-helix-helix protein
MTTVRKGDGKKGHATAFRLFPSTLDKLRREAARRSVTHTALITSLIEQLGADDGPAKVDPRIAETAAIACLAVLDLLDSESPVHDNFAAAASKLEDFIDALGPASGS